MGYLISQGPGQAEHGLRFGFNSSGQPFCGFWDDTLTGDVALDTEWHHWACTYDATSKLRTLYRDGVQIGQNTATSNYLGTGATDIGELFQGAIDEVGIWTEALSADDVKELYDKVKVEDQSVLTCQLPAATATAELVADGPTLRETTTPLGEVSQTLTPHHHGR